MYSQPPQPQKIHPAILVAAVLVSLACLWYIGGSLWAHYQSTALANSIRATQEQAQQHENELFQAEVERNHRIDAEFMSRQPREQNPNRPDLNNSPSPEPFPGSGVQRFR